jgi:hypothetical protein
MGVSIMADIAENLSKVRAFLQERGAGIGREILINFLLPFLIFDFGKPQLGDVHALMLSSAPPIAWSIVEFLRRRRVDALSILVLAGIALSLLAYLGGGSVKFLQLREKLVTVSIGLVFLGSAAIGRPLIYQLARATIQRRSQSELEAFEALRDNVFFRRTMMIMTLVWGFGLVIDAAISASLVMVLTVKQYLIVGPVVGYGAIGLLSFWTYWYSRRKRREGEARRALAEAEATART